MLEGFNMAKNYGVFHSFHIYIFLGGLMTDNFYDVVLLKLEYLHI